MPPRPSSPLFSPWLPPPTSEDAPLRWRKMALWQYFAFPAIEPWETSSPGAQAERTQLHNARRSQWFRTEETYMVQNGILHQSFCVDAPSQNGVAERKNRHFLETARALLFHMKIVEHIFLLRAKPELSDVEEKDMLDYLYTTQYQMSGILAISLGRIEEPNVEDFTHAVYMRFQKKEDLAKFYVNSYYLGVLKEHVIPYCYGSVSVDYESEVRDDILPIFRRGEEFNYGVEFVLLISAIDTAPGHAVKDALSGLENLISSYQSIVVQATQGPNFKFTDSEYTHAAVIRFPSAEALELFRGSQEYKDMWRSKFQSVTRKVLVIHYVVDPVGTELM